MPRARLTNTTASVDRPFEAWFWGFCIFMLTTPFMFNISGVDPHIGVTRNLATMSPGVAGSTLGSYEIRAAIAAIAIVAAGRFLQSHLNNPWRLMPVLLFVGWALLSTLWTDARITTAAAGVMLSLIIVIGCCMAARLQPQAFARSVFYSGIWMAVFSVIWSIALPRYGVHQMNDASQSVHAGAWRGVYIHKNILGQTAGTYAALALCCGREIIKSIWTRLIFFAAMMFLIVKSDSATAPVIVALAPLLAWVVIGLNGEKRIVAAWLILPIAIVLFFTLPYILELMGRDMTFTGRTGVWRLAPHSIAGSPIVGYGYGSPTNGDFAYRVHEMSGVFDTHNGYLELTLGLGLVGVLLFLHLLYRLWHRARMMYVHGSKALRAYAFASATVTLAWLVGNMSESNMKAMGAVFTLAFLMSAGLLFYALPTRSAVRQPVNPAPRPPYRSLLGAHGLRQARGITPAE